MSLKMKMRMVSYFFHSERLHRKNDGFSSSMHSILEKLSKSLPARQTREVFSLNSMVSRALSRFHSSLHFTIHVLMVLIQVLFSTDYSHLLALSLRSRLSLSIKKTVSLFFPRRQHLMRTDVRVWSRSSLERLFMERLAVS